MSLSFNNMKQAVHVVLSSGHVPCIVGLQGIGKTDLVVEYASEYGYPFQKVTCSLLQEGDLAMPYLPREGFGIEYAINKVITQLAEKAKDKKCILFLDEFNRASEKVQSELMNLVLQREILTYKLPENILIVLAMNPSSEMEGYEDTDYSVARSDTAILGRVCFLNLEVSLSEWMAYGERVVDGEQIVHQCVLDFLASNISEFTTKEEVGKINNTPRGWSRVSDILRSYEEIGLNNKSILVNMLQGTLRSSTASAFYKYYSSKRKSLDYMKMAKSVLENDTDGWDKALFSMNDIGLYKVFNYLMVLFDGSYEGTKVGRFITYVVSCPAELAHSMVSDIIAKNNDLYRAMLKDKDFAKFVSSLLLKVQNTEVGGFVGKK